MKNILKSSVWLLALVLTFSSCDKEDEGTKSTPLLPDVEEPHPNFTLGEDTRVISDAWETAVSTARNDVITLASGSEVELPKVGDILIKMKPSSTFPYGFLGKVTEIRTADGQAQIVTESVPLDEAFDELNIDLQNVDITDCLTNLEALGGVPVNKSVFDVSTYNAGNQLRAVSSLTLFDLLWKPSWGSGSPFKLSGDINLNMNLDFVLKINNVFKKSKNEFKLVLTSSIAVDLGLTYNQSISYNKEYKLNTASLDYDLTLTTGIPLHIYVDIYAVIKANGSIDFKTDYSYTANAEVGVHYTNGKWTNIHNASSTQELSSKLTMNGHIGVGPKLSVGIGVFRDPLFGSGDALYAEVNGTALLDLRAKFKWDLDKAASGDLWGSFGSSGVELNVIQSTDIKVGSDWLGMSYTQPISGFTIPLVKGRLLPAITGLKSEGGKINYRLSDDVVFPGKFGLQFYDKDGSKVNSPVYENSEASSVSKLPSKEISFDIPANAETARPLFNLFGLDIVKNETVNVAEGSTGKGGEDNSIPPTGITLNESALMLSVGDTGTLYATVKPSNATNKNVTWTSNNTFVATVDSVGKVTAVAKGMATITAQAGDVTAMCAVNCIQWAASNVDAPDSFAAKPEDAGMFYQWNRNVGWSSSDPMVNSNGGTTWNQIPEAGDAWNTANDPCPAGWRLPTVEELQSLVRSGNWTTRNGVNGFVCSGNTVFLPAAGYRAYGTGQFLSRGIYGNYWSSEAAANGKNGAGSLFFFDDMAAPGTYETRSSGQSVRCVAK
ncbi:hypothetical protein AGMMS49525_12410 [Bacteroidia bacterium]|nr:hypothetical protein AGMMS49525_12410 [Bacteroidia bacterium]